jgi:DNA-binding CsgD family transcriptional regulator
LQYFFIKGVKVANLESELPRSIHFAQRSAWATLQRANLDASLGFLAARSKFAGSLNARGHPTVAGVEVVGIGLGAIRRSLRNRTCRELLSIGTDSTAESFDACHAADYRLLTSGTPLISLYDYDSTDEDGHAELLRRRGWGNSYYCSSRVQLKIYDRRCVVMEIPPVRGERTVIAVTDRAVLVEALRYFRTVQRTATPIELPEAETAEVAPAFSPRQHRVIQSLARGRTDQQIAAELRISLRTLHYDVAHINRELGVTSRFAAGVRLAQLGMLTP